MLYLDLRVSFYRCRLGELGVALQEEMPPIDDDNMSVMSDATMDTNVTQVSTGLDGATPKGLYSEASALRQGVIPVRSIMPHLSHVRVSIMEHITVFYRHLQNIFTGTSKTYIYLSSESFSARPDLSALTGAAGAGQGAHGQGKRAVVEGDELRNPISAMLAGQWNPLPDSEECH